MEVINSNLDRIKTPGANDKVYKDECFFSFDTPESETGLYVCLNRWIGVGHKYLTKYSNRTDNKVFLHMKRTKKVQSRLFVSTALANMCYYRKRKRKLRVSLRRFPSLPSTWREGSRRRRMLTGTRS